MPALLLIDNGKEDMSHVDVGGSGKGDTGLLGDLRKSVWEKRQVKVLCVVLHRGWIQTHTHTHTHTRTHTHTHTHMYALEHINSIQHSFITACVIASHVQERSQKENLDNYPDLHTNNQGCFIRSFGTFNTVKYALNTQCV